jgi:SAM-dependent methyltransferase
MRPITAAGPAYDTANDTEHRRNLILMALPATPGRALDIGAGSGWLSHDLAELGWDVTAVEPGPFNRPDITHIDRRLTNTELNELLEERWDLITGLNIVHHMNDPRAALMALYNRRPATLILQIPDRIEAGNPKVAGNNYIDRLYDIAHSLEPSVLGWASTNLDPRARRPVLAWDTDIIIGTVTAGNGHTTHQWPEVGAKVATELGLELTEGSLNLELERFWSSADELDVVAATQWGPILGREVTVAGVTAWALRMPDSDQGQRFTELVAEHNLRDLLGLNNGDRIPLRLEPSS